MSLRAISYLVVAVLVAGCTDNSVVVFDDIDTVCRQSGDTVKCYDKSDGSYVCSYARGDGSPGLCTWNRSCTRKHEAAPQIVNSQSLRESG